MSDSSNHLRGGGILARTNDKGAGPEIPAKSLMPVSFAVGFPIVCYFSCQLCIQFTGPVPRTSCWRNRSSIAVKPLSAKKRNQIASAHPPVWHSSVGFTINQSVSPGTVIAISPFIIITCLSFSHFQSVKSTTLLPPTIQKSSFRIRLRSDKPQFQGQP